MDLIKVTLFFSLLLFSCTGNDESHMEKQLEELKIYLSNESISETLYNKLKEYIESGAYLDSDDWLYFLQKDFKDESSLDIKKLQEKRYSEIDFVEASVAEILKRAGFFAHKNFVPSKPRIQVKQREFVEQSVKIAYQDHHKLIDLDVEGDVWEGNKSYVNFLNQMKVFTQGVFSPEEIEEIWETPKGPIEVKYILDGQLYSFHPEYVSDWYDLHEVFNQINEFLAKEEYGIYTISAEYITGQEALLLFLSKEEKEVLEMELDWQLNLLN